MKRKALVRPFLFGARRASKRSLAVSLIPFDDLKPKKGIPLSKCQLWRLEKAGKFPKRISVSAHRVAWDEQEIDSYIAERAAARDMGVAA